MSHYLIAAIAVALLCLLVAAARTNRPRGPRRYGTWCGAAESTPELVALHERYCHDCQRIIRQLKETNHG